MKITVTSIDETGGWKPADAGATFKPIFTLAIKEKSEPIKTQDPSLNVLGTHEAYEKPAKSGKMYWHSGVDASGSTETYTDGAKAGNALNVAVAALQAKISKEDLLEYAQYVFDNFPKVEVKDEVTSQYKEMVEPPELSDKDKPPF